ncbi:hypothetical protein GCM10028798_04270 [Humibacter antri]
MSSTTIKVSNALRDRIAERAHAQHTTMANAIEAALDASDEQRFWDAVRRENEALTPEARDGYLRSGGTDALADASDDEISNRGDW